MEHQEPSHNIQHEQQRQEEPQQQQQRQPSAALSEALTAANALLLASLSVGQVPCTDDEQLLQQIAAYRASIQDISRRLETQEGGFTPGTNTDAQQQQQQQEQQQPHGDTAAAAPEPGSNDAAPLAGLGEEGVDYTVRPAP